MNQKFPVSVAPWYRHPWPWILMAGPFIVVVAGVITAYLAVRSNDGLVADDYYKQGLAINQLTAREQRAVRLGWQAEIMLASDGLQLRILLRGAPDALLPKALILRIAHPTRAGADQVLTVPAERNGTYAATLLRPLTGRWHLVLEDEKGDWRLTGDWLPEKASVLHLPQEAAGPK